MTATRWTLAATAALAVATVAAALLSTGCIGMSCTAIGWYEGLSVDLVTDKGYPDGAYEVVVVADGVVLRASFGVSEGGPHCGRVAGDTEDCWLRADGDARGFAGNLELRFDDPASPRMTSVFVNVFRADDDLDGGPRHAEIRLVRDGAEVASFELEPRYSSEELNGRGCGKATRASATFAVSP